VSKDQTTRRTTGRTDLAGVHIAELQDQGDAQGFCGDAPYGRLSDSGHLASTDHGLCHECFYPVPLVSLKDAICGTCRGEDVCYEVFTDLPVRADYL
jgi:hypothetical protein